MLIFKKPFVLRSTHQAALAAALDERDRLAADNRALRAEVDWTKRELAIVSRVFPFGPIASHLSHGGAAARADADSFYVNLPPVEVCVPFSVAQVKDASDFDINRVTNLVVNVFWSKWEDYVFKHIRERFRQALERQREQQNAKVGT